MILNTLDQGVHGVPVCSNLRVSRTAKVVVDRRQWLHGMGTLANCGVIHGGHIIHLKSNVADCVTMEPEMVMYLGEQSSIFVGESGNLGLGALQR